MSLDKARKSFSDDQTKQGKTRHDDNQLSRYFTVEERATVERGTEAANLMKRTFETWMFIARACKVCNDAVEDGRIKDKGAFLTLLKEADIYDVLGNTDRSVQTTANDLLRILKKEDEVLKWRKTLKPLQSIKWSAPSTILKHCYVFQTTQSPKPERVPKDTAQAEAKALKAQLAAMHNESPADTVAWLERDGKLAEVVAIAKTKLPSQRKIKGLRPFLAAWKEQWAPIEAVLWDAEAFTPEQRLEAITKLEDDVHQARIRAEDELGCRTHPAPAPAEKPEKRKMGKRPPPSRPAPAEGVTMVKYEPAPAPAPAPAATVTAAPAAPAPAPMTVHDRKREAIRRANNLGLHDYAEEIEKSRYVRDLNEAEKELDRREAEKAA